MSLFDDIQREYVGPAFEGEGYFDYLNRSARSLFARIRETLEAWFLRYPADGQDELNARIRSNEDSAFFELTLHEMLLGLGCQVTLHPDVPGAGEKHPDFLVLSPQCGPFYMEAILSTGESAEDVSARRRMDDAYNALNNFECPDFFIHMSLDGAPATPPSAKAMRRFLRCKLEGLDPDELGEAMKAGGLEALPHWPYEHDGWRIRFYPIPKGPGFRGKPGVRPVGSRVYGMWGGNCKDAIKGAIVKKASRYGELDQPYVIAVNVLDDFVDDTDITQALFGTEQWTIAVGPQGIAGAPQMRRKRDGVWIDAGGPRYTRLSAVLIAEKLHHWNVPMAKTRLYHNPWAQRPCGCELRQLPQAVPHDGQMVQVDGRSLGDVLGLPQGWPGAEE
jgi:hypothetical protein